MAEIVKFPKQDEIIYICACGCQSFNIHDNGAVECCNCGNFPCNAISPEGSWAKRLPPVPDEISETEASTVNVKAMGSPVFARMSVLREITRQSEADELVFLTGYKKDGTGKHWFVISSDEEKEWILDRLRDLLKYVEKIHVKK